MATAELAAPAPIQVGVGTLLRRPAVARLLTGALTGRMPTSIAPIAIVLLTTRTGGSYATGGALAGAYGIASAAGQPALARIADRRGLTLPLLGAAAVSASAWILLALTHAVVLATVAVIVGGLATPPIEGTLRALWPHTVTPAQLPAAFALDASSQTVIYVGGPLLVATALQLTSPSVILVASGILGLAGTRALTSSSPARRWRTTPTTGHLLGPLHDRKLRTLYAALTFVGIALGTQVVAAAAVTAHQGSPADAGLLLATFSLGSLLGGLLLGTSRALPADPGRRLRALLIAFSLGWLPLLTAGHIGRAGVILLAAVPGLALAPLLAAAFGLCAAAAPREHAAEAASWLVAAVGLGSAAGSAMAGPLTDHTVPVAGYLIAAGAAALAAAVARPTRTS